MRQTSIDAYYQIKERGLLGRLQFIVYDDIWKSQGTTAGETAMRLKIQGFRQNSISPRFRELEDMGVIASGLPRTCLSTGKCVLTYYPTENLPQALPVRISSKQIIANLIKEVESLKLENEHLRSLARSKPIQ